MERVALCRLYTVPSLFSFTSANARLFHPVAIRDGDTHFPFFASPLSILLARLLLFVPRGSEFLFHQLSCLTGGFAFLARLEPVDFFENDARFSKYLRRRITDRSANSIFSETSGSLILSFYGGSLFRKTRVADNVGKANSSETGKDHWQMISTTVILSVLYCRQCGLLTR